MDRQKLIVRRFGALSFGLGYFEDGIWIDHLAAPGATIDSDADSEAETDTAGIAAIHALLDCCGHGAARPLAAITVDAATRNGVPREPVAAVGRSASP
jgi:hypothetical protein